MLVLGIFGYLAIGYASLFAAIMIHMIKAEKAGYDCLDWWSKRIANYYPRQHDNLIDGNFIIGMIIWPIRLAQFIADIPKYYEEYGFKY